MNRKKILIFFVVMAFAFVAFAVEGECSASAEASKKKCSTKTSVKCKVFRTKKDKDSDGPNCPASCRSSVNCRTAHARAWAKADHKNGTSSAQAFATAKAWWGSASASSSQPDIDTNFVAIDTTTVEMNVDGGEVELSLSGKMNALPETASRLTIYAYQNADESDAIFTGKAILNGNTRELQVTGFSPGDFTVTESGDTTMVEFNFIHGPISYSGSADSLGIILTADPVSGVEVPALTEYALIILVILVAGSGIWLLLRKRRAVRA